MLFSGSGFERPRWRAKQGTGADQNHFGRFPDLLIPIDQPSFDLVRIPQFAARHLVLPRPSLAKAGVNLTCFGKALARIPVAAFSRGFGSM